MNTSRTTKLIHEGQYVAEVDVDMVQDDGTWGPYLSVEATSKLEEVRAALKRGDLKAAAKLGRISSLTPVAV